VWTLADMSVRYQFSEHLAPVRALAFSSDGNLLAAGGGQVQVSESRPVDNNISVWDMNTGETAHRLGAHVAAVRSIAFSPDGNSLISGSDDNSVILWNLAEGTFVRRHSGHRDTVRIVAFSPDGSQFASGSNDISIIVWNTETGSIVHRLAG